MVDPLKLRTRPEEGERFNVRETNIQNSIKTILRVERHRADHAPFLSGRTKDLVYDMEERAVEDVMGDRHQGGDVEKDGGDKMCKKCFLTQWPTHRTHRTRIHGIAKVLQRCRSNLGERVGAL